MATSPFAELKIKWDYYPTRKGLSLGPGTVTKSDCEALVNAFKHGNPVRFLDLILCEIEDVNLLMQGLVAHCPLLNDLHLDGRYLEDDDVEVICQALPRMRAMKVVEVYTHCPFLRSTMAQLFAKAVLQCEQLVVNPYHLLFRPFDNQLLERAPDVRSFFAFFAASECAERGHALWVLGSNDGDKSVRVRVFKWLVEQ